MTHTAYELAMATPEILLLVLALGILIVDVWRDDPSRGLTFRLTLVATVVVALSSGWQWHNEVQGSTFGGLYVTDSLAHLLKILACAATAATLVYGRSYADARDMTSRGGELYALALFSLLGQLVMISAGNLVTLFLGLELMSFALYALVALRRDHVQSVEAAMKYFILGALSSGILLYGLSMVYGATGHLDLARIAQTIGAGQADRLPMVFGTVFVVAGLAFKLAVAPFHMWSPDVYEGSPTTVTLLVGAAPKLATIAITLRLLSEGLYDLALDWQPMLILLAVASLAIGNLTAIMQTSFKRMLAYSTISHMGFVLLGLLAGGGSVADAHNAYGASLYYMVIYVLTTLSTFGLVLLLSRAGFECDRIEDFKGLNRRHPLLAAVLLMSMFSLAGIPPLVGFYAKLSVLQAVVGAGHLWLAIVAVMFSLIGAFYYLRVVKVAYFDEPEGEWPPLQIGVAARGMMSINGLLILALGLLPGGLMALCEQVIAQSLRF